MKRRVEQNYHLASLHLLLCPTHDAARVLAEVMFAWSQLDDEGVTAAGRYAARGMLRFVLLLLRRLETDWIYTMQLPGVHRDPPRPHFPLSLPLAPPRRSSRSPRRPLRLPTSRIRSRQAINLRRRIDRNRRTHLYEIGLD